MEFHEKLQKLRKQKGLAQEELTKALFVSRISISKWESGRGVSPLHQFTSVCAEACAEGKELDN
ncbi:MAG: helix-turn-helix domain-containing protein [Acutalibacteraceae bacterium]